MRFQGRQGVDVVGLSILSGAHLPLCRKVKAALEERGVFQDIVWIVGGNVPGPDHAALKELGVDAVFNTGTSFEEIVGFINKKVAS